MKNFRNAFWLHRRLAVGALAFVALVMLPVTPAFAANQQLVFQDRQGTGKGTFSGSATPFGFWIWCQTTNNNAYGTACTGAMYFYKLGIAIGVAGSVTSFTSTSSTVSFTVSVSSSNGLVSNCIFTFGPSSISSGATNTVGLSCVSPSGSGSDSHVAISVVPPS